MSRGGPEVASAGAVARQRVVLVIGGDSNRLGPNSRINRQGRARIVKEWRTRARLVAQNMLNSGEARPLRGVALISFVLRRGRFLDPDNARSSACLKAIIDGIVDAGLIRGDTVELVRAGEVAQETGWRRRPEVVVLLEEE